MKGKIEKKTTKAKVAAKSKTKVAPRNALKAAPKTKTKTTPKLAQKAGPKLEANPSSKPQSKVKSKSRNPKLLRGSRKSSKQYEVSKSIPAGVMYEPVPGARDLRLQEKLEARHEARLQARPEIRETRFNRTIAYYAMGVLAIAIGTFYYLSQGDSKSSLTTHKTADATETTNHESTQATVDATTIDGPLSEEFKTVQPMGVQEKINYWSFYIESNQAGRAKLMSLVSAMKIEDDAPIIPESYNCTTFVETVAALARSRGPGDLAKNIMAIRYRGGQPSFENRNHFPEADWIPNNQSAKILVDITSWMASKVGVVASVESKNIDRGKWLSEQVRHKSISRSLASMVSKDWSAPTLAQISYIKTHDVMKFLDQIPTGTVLNFVHKNDGRHPVLITHQGFVVREGNRVMLRHASIGGEIRTSDLSEYLHELVSNRHSSSRWPMIGINFNQINDSTSANNFLSESM